jgi:uncharacterized protein YecE (DUF72 family)
LRRVPSHLQFAFKTPEQITRLEFPRIPRYGALAGRQNESFLDVELLKSSFLAPLEKYHDNIAALILEFGALPSWELEYPERFLERLSQFLRLTPHSMRFAVEIRNPELLTPDYFSCLREHGVAHVYNAWTRMPDLPEQIALPGSMTADFIVCRALLRHARTYEQAVAKFEPYSELQDEYLPAREGLRELVQIDSGAPVPRFIFVNNRLEGNAPSTIALLGSTSEYRGALLACFSSRSTSSSTIPSGSVNVITCEPNRFSFVKARPLVFSRSVQNAKEPTGIENAVAITSPAPTRPFAACGHRKNVRMVPGALTSLPK